MEASNKVIKASEALRMIKNSQQDNPWLGTVAGPVWTMAHNSCMSCVEACTEAREVVYAEWVIPDKYYPLTCSNCKFEFVWDGDDDYLPKYCPECGATMTGRRLLYI